MKTKPGLSAAGDIVGGVFEEIKKYAIILFIIALIFLTIFAITYFIFLGVVYYVLSNVGDAAGWKVFAMITVAVLALVPLFLFLQYGVDFLGKLRRGEFREKKSVTEADPTKDAAEEKKPKEKDSGSRNPIIRFFSSFFDHIRALLNKIWENKTLNRIIAGIIGAFLIMWAVKMGAEYWGGVKPTKGGVHQTLVDNGILPSNTPRTGAMSPEDSLAFYKAETKRLGLGYTHEENMVRNAFWYEFFFGRRRTKKQMEEENTASTTNTTTTTTSAGNYQTTTITVPETASNVRFKKMTDKELEEWKNDGVDYSNKYNDVSDNNYQYTDK